VRLFGKLTAKRVAKLLHKGEPGNFHDGNGLRLEIRSSNSASWVSRYELNGREHWMGLGPVRAFGLAEARERNRKLVRQKLADGIDPLTERRATRAAERAAVAKTVTFAEAAKSYIAGNAAKWRSTKHGAQWSATLKTYAFPVIGALSVADIDVPLILKVLEQHVSAEPAGNFWATRTETASRVRGRIEAVLDWATARGLRSGDNPASWKTIGKVLPARGAKVVHHPALPYAEVPTFVADLSKRQGVAARALLFTILSASRSNEALGARWNEINLGAQTWTVPGARMKGGTEHVVPLSPAVLDLLRVLPREAGDDGFMFIGSHAGKRLAHDAMNAEISGMGRSDLTVHGFRSSFRDWAAEQTAFSHDVCEAALAHTVGDASERAYRRTKQLPRRRQLMDAWAAFCTTAPMAAGDNVVAMGGGHGRS
jgi:integrase